MDRDAFTARVVDIREMLYRVSFSMLPNPHDQDDAVQETIRIALQKRETLRQDAFFRTWIVRILINECHRILRNWKREAPLDETRANLPADGNSEVAEALAALDVKFRLPLVLCYIEGYSNDEVARMMRLPVGTVKWRLSKGRALLREQMDEGRERKWTV